jgi:hypothetical protein
MPFILGPRLRLYAFVTAIGAGGMGEVYRVRDTELNHAVSSLKASGRFA